MHADCIEPQCTYNNDNIIYMVMALKDLLGFRPSSELIYLRAGGFIAVREFG